MPRKISEKWKAYQKTYQAVYRNSLKEKLRKKKWYEANKVRIAAKNKVYKRNKLETDKYFRLCKNLRRRVLMALKRKIKSEPTQKLLGASFEKVRNHLSSLFKEGMSWDNYGKWHVDHIRPCASFDLNQEDQQHQCFHYTNLQPLWAIDNLKKSDKVDPD
jgi:hypothetical protein